MITSKAMGRFFSLFVSFHQAEGTLYAVGTQQGTLRAALYKVDDITGSTKLINPIHISPSDDSVPPTFYPREFLSMSYDSSSNQLVALVKSGMYSSDMLFIDETTGNVTKIFRNVGGSNDKFTVANSRELIPL